MKRSILISRRSGHSLITSFHSRENSVSIGASHSLETIRENNKRSINPKGSKKRPIIDNKVRLVKTSDDKSRCFKPIVSSEIYHWSPNRPELSGDASSEIDAFE
ncbi:hypothetical protein DERF_001546 [Dermatophagoides farinae]|uniref:Uncharacterized protein n=1 Tax=Dermatophagoides farinae TaxID=6954 RepID=A0A922IB41_DERFA|nr:hypothetical protein DERF_001546 [Dermatophagoides farinae]